MVNRVFALVLFLLAAATSAVFAQRGFYWDDSAPFSPGYGSFPQTASHSDFAIAAWQEEVRHTSSGEFSTGEIYIQAAVRKADGEAWLMRGRVAGPFPYTGTEPSLFTLTVDSNGYIFLCVAANSSQTEIFISKDFGESWKNSTIENAGTADTGGNMAADGALVPRIFQTHGGGYLLFIVRNAADSVTLFYARSSDGQTWSAFQRFVTEPGIPLSILPTHLAWQESDIIVFQAFISGPSHSSYQLFIKTSTNDGQSWSTARRLTNFADPYINTTAPPDSFNNERAHLALFEDAPFLVWERRYSSNSPSIYGVFLDKEFALAGKPERINSELVFCNNPLALNYKGALHVFWFDNRRGENAVIYATKIGAVWENYVMTRNGETGVFPRPAVSGPELFVFWQNAERERGHIVMLGRDMIANPPELTPLNFASGKRVSSDVARISWDIPADSSGIEGFSWSWSQDIKVEPPLTIMGWADTTKQEMHAFKDGPWYFKTRALDNAGNWSESSAIVFVRDTTPPPPVFFIMPPTDANGFLLSNSFTLRWHPSIADDLAGYSWVLDYLGPAGSAAVVPRQEAVSMPPGMALEVMSDRPVVSYNNYDNGLWRLSVYPLDDIGNVGEPRALYFKLNKYIPHTYITYMDTSQTYDGDLSLSITGRGFIENGTISHIYLSRADEESYERVLSYTVGDYDVANDRNIEVRRIENLPAGNYYVSVEHPLRGIVRSVHTIAVGRSLTYKFGDFTQYWEASWFAGLSRLMSFDVWTAVWGMVMVFCVMLFLFAIRGAAIVLTESRAINLETAALLYGKEMPITGKENLKRLKRKGAGLRLKLASFTVALVSLVVGMVAIPLYMVMNANQRTTLMQSLWDRSSVLLESLASGVRTFLPANNVLELGFLPAQSDAIQEVLSVTITGFAAQGSLTPDYVWASNDAELLNKINTPVFEPGVSRLNDTVLDRLPIISAELNERALLEVGDIAATVADLNREGRRLLEENDALSRRQLENIQNTTAGLNQLMSNKLYAIAETVYAEPHFDVNARRITETEYHFYKPVLFRQPGSDIYVRGWVILSVNSHSIVEIIAQEQQRILTLIIIIALAAIALGGALSFVLATFIILPIKTLVRHVEMIRDTEDKTALAGTFIDKKRYDEIGVLSETINEMTEGLVRAASASRDLSVGKEIQKKFIPLEIDSLGNKLTAGHKETPLIEFFGYYEGAKGVSGDYFDYRDLDGRYYAIIKCDVAGKGVPAALIMVQVATMFVNFFRRWTPDEKGMRINDLVYQINAFIEELGFRGRFAAFTLCIFDSQTGVVRFCNAGDNMIHYYDASEKKFKELTLPQTPATGVLPNALVEKKGGYGIQSITLDYNDILLLYTDGIEEAKRMFRDSHFNEIECTYNNAPRDTPHENHTVGQNNEELGADRVEAIINTVMRQQTYTLIKYHNAHSDQKYHFDFSTCTGSVEDLIMALVSVEKIFRMWKNPANTANKILVDKRIDTFLQKHFIEYKLYCADTLEYAENSTYMYYTGMNEDEQYDDLTMLGIRRKP